MKKSKFILPIIGMVSIIAGSLAFKAQHRFHGTLACYTTASNVTNHTFLGKVYTTTNSGFVLNCTVPVQGARYEIQAVVFAL